MSACVKSHVASLSAVCPASLGQSIRSVLFCLPPSLAFCCHVRVRLPQGAKFLQTQLAAAVDRIESFNLQRESSVLLQQHCPLDPAFVLINNSPCTPVDQQRYPRQSSSIPTWRFLPSEKHIRNLRTYLDSLQPRTPWVKTQLPAALAPPRCLVLRYQALPDAVSVEL
jgi:hypothetical protein